MGMDIDEDHDNESGIGRNERETEPRVHAALSKKFEFSAKRSQGKNKRRISSNSNLVDLDSADEFSERGKSFRNIRSNSIMKGINHTSPSHGSIASRGTGSQSGGSGDTLYEDVILSLRHDKDFIKTQSLSTTHNKYQQNPSSSSNNNDNNNNNNS